MIKVYSVICLLTKDNHTLVLNQWNLYDDYKISDFDFQTRIRIKIGKVWTPSVPISSNLRENEPCSIRRSEDLCYEVYRY